MAADTTLPPVSYAELARFFLRFGFIAFGGPVAHIALGEEELVTRRKWLTREHYLDLVAATNLLPGPNSTEVMIHVGYLLKGIPGAILTGTCCILPSFLLTMVLAVIYMQTGAIPQAEAVLWGIKPVVVAIIANAGYRLMRAALTNSLLWQMFIIAVLVIVMTTFSEVVVMLAVGLVYALIQVWPKLNRAMLVVPFVGTQSAGTRYIASLQHTEQLNLLLQAAAATPSLWDIFLYFLKIGAILFGSGYVLIAYIQQDVVNTFGWLTTRQLLDAVAIGQITPGPVSTTASMVGYILAGLPGALVATLGIFLPSFVFVVLSAPFIPRMRDNLFFSAFLSGVNAGVIAAILVTLIDLMRGSIYTLDGAAVSPIAVGIGVVSLLLLIRTRLNPTWLILAGALVGLVVGLSG
jgi:chromate transporter